METSQALVGTVHHVQAFLDEDAALIAPSIPSVRHDCDDALTKPMTIAATQMGDVITVRGATAKQRALRSTLRTGHVQAIAQLAKRALSGAPAINLLALTTKTLSGAVVVAATQRIADAAAPYASVCTENGLSDDIVAQSGPA